MVGPTDMQYRMQAHAGGYVGAHAAKHCTENGSGCQCMVSLLDTVVPILFTHYRVLNVPVAVCLLPKCLPLQHPEVGIHVMCAAAGSQAGKARGALPEREVGFFDKVRPHARLCLIYRMLFVALFIHWCVCRIYQVTPCAPHVCVLCMVM